MEWVSGVLGELGVTSGGGEPRTGAFPDGAAFRIEIPSVEGPRVLDDVLRAAETEGITVNRVSQGSGAMLLRACELPAVADKRGWPLLHRMHVTQAPQGCDYDFRGRGGRPG